MFKRIIAGVLMFVMLSTVINITIPLETVYAFDNFEVEVIKDKAPIREGYYGTKDVKKWVTKGTKLTIIGEKRNLYFKLWYKVKGGGYIFSENVKKAHNHKVEFSKYESQHPHYAIHKCKHCDIGARCGPETTKVKGCEKCYPTSTESKKQNTNKVPNSNVTTKADILVPKQDSLQEEMEKKIETPIHEDNYKFSHYSSTHPHYAVYKCSCGKSYEDKNKTQKMNECKTCYPPHQHDYKLVGYNKEHPHTAKYECTSGDNGYSDSNVTAKDKECSECYPYGYGNDHFCQFVCTNEFLNEHPHYTITECTICGKQDIDRQDTNYSVKCDMCNSSFGDKIENVPDFYGRVYDLSTGGIIYTPEKVTLDELYDFSERMHLNLDMLGLIPAVGEVFDGINVLYYIVEGNYVDAAISGAAMIPIVGVVSTTGKIVKKSGKIIRNAAKETFEEVTEEVLEEAVEKQLKENLTDLGREIIDNSSKYSEVTLRNIKNIAEESDIYLTDAFYDGKLLISPEYKGTVRSPAGLEYKTGSYEGHRIYHLLERHGSSLKGTPDHGTLFNVDGKQLFETIDEVYSSGNMITYVPRENGKIDYYYDAGKVIGLKGETKLKMIYENDILITAHPVSKVPD